MRRILEANFKLGLFEDLRVPVERKACVRHESDFSRAQAQRAAEETLILLKNNGIDHHELVNGNQSQALI